MKVIGYIAIVVGLLIAAATRVESISSRLTFLPKDFLNNYGLYIAIGFILLGVIIFFLFRGSSSAHSSVEEIPIYHGKRIVGYRRG